MTIGKLYVSNGIIDGRDALKRERNKHGTSLYR
jgi:hypothetical protein